MRDLRVGRRARRDGAKSVRRRPPPCLFNAHSMPPRKAKQTSSRKAEEAEPKEAKIVSAPDAIRGILQVDASQSLGSVVEALAKLPAAPLPAVMTAVAMQPRRTPRCNCFDTASQPSRWSAHNACRRCEVLNQLLQRTCNHGWRLTT